MLGSALAELRKFAGRRTRLELDLLLTQAMALRSVRGYSAPEVEQALTGRACFVPSATISGRDSVSTGDCSNARSSRATSKVREALPPTWGASGAIRRAIGRRLSRQRQIAFTTGEFETAMTSSKPAPPMPAGSRPAALPHSWPECRSVLSFLPGAHALPPGISRPRHATIERARRSRRCARRIQGISIAGSPRGQRGSRPSSVRRSRGREAAANELSRLHVSTATPTMRPWADASSAGWPVPRASSTPASQC